MPGLRYLNGILSVLAVLLALNLWTAWSADGRRGAWESSAYAQGIPDSGAQRKEQIDLLKQLNAKMDEVKELLKSGSVRVRVEAGAAK